MSKLIMFFITTLIRLYKYLISPLLGERCRYLPTCSDYFLESLKINGLTRGFYNGTKRMLSCHPIKFLGGGSGLDFVVNKKQKEKRN